MHPMCIFLPHLDFDPSRGLEDRSIVRVQGLIGDLTDLDAACSERLRDHENALRSTRDSRGILLTRLAGALHPGTCVHGIPWWTNNVVQFTYHNCDIQKCRLREAAYQRVRTWEALFRLDHCAITGGITGYHRVSQGQVCQLTQ